MFKKDFRYSSQIVGIILFALAFVSKLIFIDSRDICIDEPFTIFHAQKSVLDILRLPAQNEPNPPFFMLLLHFWMKLFGTSPQAIRVLPLFFNALTPVVLFLIGKRYFKFEAGVFAALFYIASTTNFYFGLETRVYSMLSFFTATSLLCFLELINGTKNRRWFVLLMISNLLMVYSHYFGWFIVFSQFITSFLYLKKVEKIKKVWFAILATFIGFIPMFAVFIEQFMHKSGGTWVQAPNKGDFIRELTHFTNGKTALLVFLAVAFIGVLLYLINDWKVKLNKKLLVVLLWWMVPYTIMFVTSFKIPMFINRYLLFHSIGIYLTMAILIATLYKNERVAGIVFSGVVLFLMLNKLEINSKFFYYREVKNAVEFVQSEKDENSIIIIHPHWAHLGFTYYYDQELFKDYEGIENRYSDYDIYPVWNLEGVKGVMNKNPGKKIIYYQDGATVTDPDFKINNFLKQEKTFKGDTQFPQCFVVSIFEEKIDTLSHE